MKKIVILGCENSHANSFLNFIRDNPKYSDVEVLGVYSDDAPAAQKLADEYGVKIMGAYDEAVGQVDGVIVTARHGDNHYKYAKPYIESGVPMFIDKPITISEAEAIQMMQEFKTAGVRVTGGSSVIHETFVQTLKKEREENVDGKTLGGLIRCPISMKNAYGDFFFYSEHLVGVMSEIFGFYPKTVRAFQNGGIITVVFRYADYDIVGLFTEGYYSYYAERSSENGVHGEVFPLEICFQTEFDEYYSLLCGGAQKKSYEDFIAPVFVLNAIQRSLDSGKEECVNEFKL